MFLPFLPQAQTARQPMDNPGRRVPMPISTPKEIQLPQQLAQMVPTEPHLRAAMARALLLLPSLGVCRGAQVEPLVLRGMAAVAAAVEVQLILMAAFICHRQPVVQETDQTLATAATLAHQAVAGAQAGLTQQLEVMDLASIHSEELEELAQQTEETEAMAVPGDILATAGEVAAVGQIILEEAEAQVELLCFILAIHYKDQQELQAKAAQQYLEARELPELVLTTL
jgi:hypothetical protein